MAAYFTKKDTAACFKLGFLNLNENKKSKRKRCARAFETRDRVFKHATECLDLTCFNSCLRLKTKQNVLICNNKKSCLRNFHDECNRFRNDLQFSLNCIDFVHISAIFLSSSDNLLKSHDSIQQKKFNKLLRGYSQRTSTENGDFQTPAPPLVRGCL